MRVIIIEDEEASQQYLKNILCNEFQDITVIDIIDNVPEAVLAIENNKPDAVFLDVEIKLGSGFDVLSQLKNNSFALVFTTAYNQFAIDAFRKNAIDYLLKPLKKELVIEATMRCIRYHEADRTKGQVVNLLNQIQFTEKNKKLGIHDQDGINWIEIEEIVFCEAKGNYTMLVLKSGMSKVASKKLREIEECLPKNMFFRIHNSYIVNKFFIQKYQRGRGGIVILSAGQSLPVAVSKKDEFLIWMG